MDSQLIFDIGCHDGKDTDFYLRKGFRVVAIDANPIFCEALRGKHASEVASRQLVVNNIGIADRQGTLDFYSNLDNSEWSSFDPVWGTRNGTKFEVLRVKTTSLQDLVDEYGMPYYMKVDVEGFDIQVVRALAMCRDRPRYMSIEENRSDFFAELYSVGARRFKLVNQTTHHLHPLPNPAKEGNFVAITLAPGSSGAFGEEAPGEWLDFGHVIEKYHREVRNASGEYFAGTSWYDIHAKFEA